MPSSRASRGDDGASGEVGFGRSSAARVVGIDKMSATVSVSMCIEDGLRTRGEAERAMYDGHRK
jgi:hypothetical protein